MAALDRQRELVKGWIDQAERIVGLTGAGISTNSGIPDFRGPEGVWTKNPDAERLSDIRYYVSDPEGRKERWARMVAHADAGRTRPQPNEGHRAFVTLAERGKLHAVLTQNVDGLHVEAGLDPSMVVEVHGNTREVTCLSCGERAPTARALDRVRAGEEDPPCRTCGGILKTAVISFGQSLVEDDLVRAEKAARQCDLMLCVGSKLSVYPIAGVVPVAKHSGARVVIINAEPTAFDGLADAVLQGDISALLPPLVTPPHPLDHRRT
jgi:NAD-dependent deacetylase